MLSYEDNEVLMRLENTWHEIRDHSFIQNHSRSSDSQLLLFSSLTHLLQGSDSQLLLFSSLTHLLQGSGQRTPDTRSETIPSSRITPDLQIHSFFSSVHSLIFYRVQVREHLTRDQRPFLHPESLQIFRFTASSLQFTHSSSTGFRSENTWHEIRDHSFIQNHSRLFRFTAPWRCFSLQYMAVARLWTFVRSRGGGVLKNCAIITLQIQLIIYIINTLKETGM